MKQYCMSAPSQEGILAMAGDLSITQGKRPPRLFKAEGDGGVAKTTFGVSPSEEGAPGDWEGWANTPESAPQPIPAPEDEGTGLGWGAF